MDISFIALRLLNACIVGSTYGLVAMGLALITSVMKMVNFAYGEMYMLGSFVYYFLLVSFGVHPILAIPCAMATLFAAGVLIQKYVFQFIFDEEIVHKSETSIIMGMGMAILLQKTALIGFGYHYRSTPPIIQGSTAIYSLILYNDRILAAIIALSMMFLTFLFLRKTRLGLALQATAMNREAAKVIGIRVDRMNLVAMGLGAALAAAGGSILSSTTWVYAENGVTPLFTSFAVIVLGGLGSVFGAAVACFLFAIVETLGIVLIGPSYAPIYGYLILIFTLLVRPRGLFGERPGR